MLNPANDDAAPSVSPSSATADQSHPGFASSSSRASSEARTDSPSADFANLRTPSEPDALQSFDMSGLGLGMGVDMSAFGGLPPIQEESMFTIGSSGGDYFKPGTDPLAGLSHTPFDLFGSFDSVLGNATSDAPVNASAPSTNSATTSNNSSHAFAIDPQLVGTPAPSSTESPSDIGAEPDSEDDEPRDLVIAPVKVGGKGKARRGTLQSGGVSKKPALPGPQSIFGSLSANEGPSSVVGKSGSKGAGKSKDAGKRGSKDKDQDDDEKDDDIDDWRPSPEEYAKMSSKEKRQLRNKISARNFRIRRKEYIHTLEGDIADRDRLIDAIRSELGSTQSENSALRQEVAALKKAILEGRASPMLPPPAPLSPLSPLSSFSPLPGLTSNNNASATGSGSNASNSSNIIKPNTHKDLPTSPRLGASPFWGGQAAFGNFGGITPVHTAIIPETTTTVFGGAATDRQKENINPALNGQPEQSQQQHQAMSQVLSQLYGHGSPNPFDSFTDVNPFTLKTLDAYRMQLWTRVAMQTQQAQRMRPSNNGSGYPSPHSSPSQSPKPTGSQNLGLSGLANNLRPQYFSSAATSAGSHSGTGKAPFGSLLSGKGLPYAYSSHGQLHSSVNPHGHGLPTPPSSPRIGEKERAQQQAQNRRAQQQREQVQTHALLANLASQTILQKLGHALWDAFSGAGTGSSPVPSHLASAATGSRAWDADKVRRILDGTAVLQVVDVDRKPSASTASSSADALADSLCSMSLGNAKQEKKEGAEKKGFFKKMSCGGCSKQ